MNKITTNAKVLIISWSPVPTPRYQKIEGSGQRFFGLANGLRENGIKDVTIAVGFIYPLDIHETNGIKLINYNFDENLVNEMSKYDTIIFNYAIHGSDFIAKNIPQNVQVIIDAYGPAYIENLARDPTDMKSTYIGNKAVVKNTFNKVLKRGDFFLFANEAQRKFYTGVLAALGVINQFTYKMDRLLWTPFGIENPSDKQFANPYKKYGVKDDDFVLLWFGGLYPWFNIRDVLDAVKNLPQKNVKFFIVGGNNPQNQHPDFVKNYFNTVEYVKKIGMQNEIIFIDWVDYATRRGYYEHADAIISVNNNGKENVYSWRTRVMDYLGSSTPLITNGGDPLSDEIVATGAGFMINDLSEEGIREVIEKIIKNPKLLVNASQKMKSLQPKYVWSATTKLLSDKIKKHETPWGDEQDFCIENKIVDGLCQASDSSKNDLKRRLIQVENLLQKVHEKGLVVSTKIFRDKVGRKVKYVVGKINPVKSVPEPRLVVVSNQFDNTGAPAVIVDLLGMFCKKYPKLKRKVVLKTFTPVTAENLAKMRQLGVVTEVYTNRSMALDLHQGDIVFFNSFAISWTTVTTALDAVKDGRVKKLFWYGHEDSPEGFIADDIRDRMLNFLNDGKVEVFAVSDGCMKNYQKYFGTKNGINKMPYRFLLDAKYFNKKRNVNFSELKFVSVGSLMDMRKGQFPILYAFLDFYHNYFIKNPGTYRNFSIEFIGAYNEGDISARAPYHIRNILEQFKASAEGLDGHFKITSSMSHSGALREIGQNNIMMCCSLREALPIFVYEGMSMGQPIIRNTAPGWNEQVVNGKNGILVQASDFAQLVNAIEDLSNRSKTSDKKLIEMGTVSAGIAKKATEREYVVIGELAKYMAEK